MTTTSSVWPSDLVSTPSSPGDLDLREATRPVEVRTPREAFSRLSLVTVRFRLRSVASRNRAASGGHSRTACPQVSASSRRLNQVSRLLQSNLRHEIQGRGCRPSRDHEPPGAGRDGHRRARSARPPRLERKLQTDTGQERQRLDAGKAFDFVSSFRHQGRRLISGLPLTGAGTGGVGCGWGASGLRSRPGKPLRSL